MKPRYAICRTMTVADDAQTGGWGRNTAVKTLMHYQILPQALEALEWWRATEQDGRRYWVLDEITGKRVEEQS